MALSFARFRLTGLPGIGRGHAQCLPQFRSQCGYRAHQRGPEYRFEAMDALFQGKEVWRLSRALREVRHTLSGTDPCGVEGVLVEKAQKPLDRDGVAPFGIGDVALPDAEFCGQLALRAQARGLQNALVCGLESDMGAPFRVHFFPRRWWQKGHSLSLLTVPQMGQALGARPSVSFPSLQEPLIWAKFFCLRGFGASSGMAFRFLVDGFQRGKDEMRQT